MKSGVIGYLRQKEKHTPLSSAEQAELVELTSEVDSLVALYRHDETDEEWSSQRRLIMEKFEEGVKLTRGCQSALKEAEQKVEILLQSAGDEELEDFEPDGD